MKRPYASKKAYKNSNISIPDIAFYFIIFFCIVFSVVFTTIFSTFMALLVNNHHKRVKR